MFELESWSFGKPKAIIKEVEPKKQKQNVKKRKVVSEDVKPLTNNISKKSKKNISSVPPPPPTTTTTEMNRNNNIFSALSKDVKSSRFRWINEKLYTSKSNEALKMFRQEPELFQIVSVLKRENIYK